MFRNTQKYTKIVTDKLKQQKTVVLSILLTNLKSNLNGPSIQVISLFDMAKKIIAGHDFTWSSIIKWSLIIFENLPACPDFFSLFTLAIIRISTDHVRKTKNEFFIMICINLFSVLHAQYFIEHNSQEDHTIKTCQKSRRSCLTTCFIYSNFVSENHLLLTAISKVTIFCHYTRMPHDLFLYDYAELGWSPF